MKHIRELLDYDHSTGALVWKARGERKGWDTRYAGKPAFTTKAANGYMVGRIGGNSYYAHRVAYCHYHGHWPEHHIDHINGIRHDNRIENLRDVTALENHRNRNPTPKNTSGTTGVWLHKQSGKWLAGICVNGKSVHLGSFSSKDDAVAARQAGKAKYGFSDRHGVSHATDW